MFSRILVPVDLEHAGELQKALEAAADIAKRSSAVVRFVTAAGAGPSAVAASLDEHRSKLEALARDQAEAHGLSTESRLYESHDVAAELDSLLLKAIEDASADLVVAGSHSPNVIDYVWRGHAASLATHAPCSVLVIR
ncbi:MAG: universal stress protein [Pseudomonadota bacterium]